MPEWIESILIRFFSTYNVSVDRAELAQQYVRIDLSELGMLEINFIPADESLLFSMKLMPHIDELMLARALQFNHFANQRPFSPTAHLYEDNLVLRVTLAREHLDVVNVGCVFDNLSRANQDLLER